jgi:hypothetical protein
VPRASASSGFREETAAGELCRRPNSFVAGRSRAVLTPWLPPQGLPRPICAAKEPRAPLLQPSPRTPDPLRRRSSSSSPSVASPASTALR